jgi:hypothetical protein
MEMPHRRQDVYVDADPESVTSTMTRPLTSGRLRHGGGLRVCGCLWRIASDDLVFPALVEFFSRVLGLSVLVGVLVFEEVTPSANTCAAEHNLNYYLFVAIVLFALTIANVLAMGWNRDGTNFRANSVKFGDVTLSQLFRSSMIISANSRTHFYQV